MTPPVKGFLTRANTQVADWPGAAQWLLRSPLHYTRDTLAFKLNFLNILASSAEYS